MSDNVILLGAGSSYDAGIPLLYGFMDVMRRMAAQGRGPKGKLSSKDHQLLRDAMEVIDMVESYHARVTLNQFDIEQVLSVLQFEASAGAKKAKDSLKVFTAAIARTIEISCNVQHTGDFNRVQSEGHPVYRRFWLELFKLFGTRLPHIPTILSFNYDLVLERSLFQVCNGHQHSGVLAQMRAKGIHINYENPKCGSTSYQLKSTTWTKNFDNFSGMRLEPLSERQEVCPPNFINIPFFKLHGSLNFPHKKPGTSWSACDIQIEPEIIPPVFNKADGIFTSKVWSAALASLRNCRNLIVCGYSMPPTDTYMVYFLKAALGPNRKLDQIHVFDPILGDKRGEELRSRYSQCFSPHFQSRIVYHPNIPDGDKALGTFGHLERTLANNPETILSGLLPKNKDSESGNTPDLFEARGWHY